MVTGIATQISDVSAKINSYLLMELHRCGIIGLAPSHVAILNYLFANKVANMKDLAKAVRRDKSTVTILVAKLVSGGYVEKEISGVDRRSSHVRLTQKGEEFRPVFMEISDNLFQRLRQGIDDVEQKDFVCILGKIGSNF